MFFSFQTEVLITLSILKWTTHKKKFETSAPEWYHIFQISSHTSQYINQYI